MGKKAKKLKSLTNANTTPTSQKLERSLFKNKTLHKNRISRKKNPWNGRKDTHKKNFTAVEDEDKSSVQEMSKENDDSASEDVEKKEDHYNDGDIDTEQSTNKNEPFDRKYTIYITGLTSKTTSPSIKKHFDDGTESITSVYIPLNPSTREPWGGAFVNFQTETAVERALEKNGSTLDERTINVVRAKNPEDTRLRKKQRLLEKLKRTVDSLRNGQDKESKQLLKKYVRKVKMLEKELSVSRK